VLGDSNPGGGSVLLYSGRGGGKKEGGREWMTGGPGLAVRKEEGRQAGVGLLVAPGGLEREEGKQDGLDCS
jgi:hypothetical protein